MKIKVKEIEIILTKDEIKQLQKDLNYIVFMREIKLSDVGQQIYDLEL